MPLVVEQDGDTGNFKVAVICITCGRRIHRAGNIVWNDDPYSDYEFTHKDNQYRDCDSTDLWPYSHDLWMTDEITLMKGNN